MSFNIADAIHRGVAVQNTTPLARRKERKMSVELYRYTAECDGDYCPGDCDRCKKNMEEEDDLISRADAVKAVESIKYTDNWKGAVIAFLSVLPSVRPTGEWVDYGDCEDICSICGYSKVHEPNYPFCPNCGADMRGDKR